ncbi:hypothetical protein [Patulibacter sp. SYSU D01012]|uniref:hypothetical protein n=1 Tax=Patulibacter sp. SYSU D01012 TaxID=2817381 RepID=UPI001B304F69|nr:hypothetical protein [Patulibacter sp. SYSU D01012]
MSEAPTRPTRPPEALASFGISAPLEVDVGVRLAKGAIEYGDVSLSRGSEELWGEMYEEALDLIGWAAILVCAEARRGGAAAGDAAAQKVAPIVRVAAETAAVLFASCGGRAT